MFQFSEKESLLLGYRVARGNASCLNEEGLLLELEKEEIDILKLSLNHSTRDLYVKLDQLGLPYYPLGITIEYKSIFTRNAQLPYLNHDLKFREYQGEDSAGFKDMVHEVFQNSPTSYYFNPGLLGITDEESQLNCLVEYIASLNQASNPNLYTHELFYKGMRAGFVCSFKEGKGGGATYAGILPKFENKGLYLDIVRFIQNFGKKLGQNWGTAQVQLQNTVGQKAFQKGGLQPNGYGLNVHVNSYFGQLKHLKAQ